MDPVEVKDVIEKVAESIPFGSSRFNFEIGMRSFLRTNGFNNLPKANLGYTLKQWHRGYKREEIRNLLVFLDNTLHKLYVHTALESGLRSKTIRAIRYEHIKENYEAGIIPCN